MTNPYQPPSLPRDGSTSQFVSAEPSLAKPSVAWLLFECVMVGVASTMGSLLFAMGTRIGVPTDMGAEYWLHTTELLMFLPSVFLIHHLLPSGWMFWAGCGLVVRTRRRVYLLMIALSGVVVGILTPMMFYIETSSDGVVGRAACCWVADETLSPPRRARVESWDARRAAG